MAYTNNVPQGSQLIPTTQPIIQANFGFLQTGLAVDHNFQAAGSGNNMYHNKASMPNQALSPALPAGTNGVYFVSSGKPYFYDGAINSNMSCWEEVLTGSWTTPAASGTYSNIAAIPANKVGIVILSNLAAPNLMQFGFFNTNATNCFGFSNLISDDPLHSTFQTYINFNNNNVGLFLQGTRHTTITAATYNYKVFYRAV